MQGSHVAHGPAQTLHATGPSLLEIPSGTSIKGNTFPQWKHWLLLVWQPLPQREDEYLKGLSASLCTAPYFQKPSPRESWGAAWHMVSFVKTHTNSGLKHLALAERQEQQSLSLIRMLQFELVDKALALISRP